MHDLDEDWWLNKTISKSWLFSIITLPARQNRNYSIDITLSSKHYRSQMQFESCDDTKKNRWTTDVIPSMPFRHRDKFPAQKYNFIIRQMNTNNNHHMKKNLYYHWLHA